MLTLNLDETGSDLTTFQNLFADGDPQPFAAAIERAFAFAVAVQKVVLDVESRPGIELWDQAVQYALAKTSPSDFGLHRDGQLVLEKSGNAHEVWRYGFGVTKAGHGRPWVLPDGLLRSGSKRIAVEFDHGSNVGRWATQLLKAVRSTHATRVDAVLYCFLYERVGGGNPFKEIEFSDEFKSLLSATAVKPVGVLTVHKATVPQAEPSSKAIALLEDVYCAGGGMSQKSIVQAQRLVEKILGSHLRGPDGG